MPVPGSSRLATGEEPYIQCEAPKIAKLVNITPITMVYGIYNYSYWGESKPTYILGARDGSPMNP